MAPKVPWWPGYGQTSTRPQAPGRYAARAAETKAGIME